MADVEEPQFTTLSQRIAALNQQGMGKPSGSVSFGKRPPPPPPPANRPSLPSRPHTTNNPPLSAHGPSATKRATEQSTGIRGQSLLPPPPVDRDQPRPNSAGKAPPLPSRNGPPPLPGRKASQASPSLPPRKSSTQMVRRGSNESTMSYSSTISGMSLGQGSSRTSTSSVETQRRLPPALGETKLPPLPPSRRELAEKTQNAKVPLVSTRSAPIVPILKPPVIDRDVRPKMPSRPTEGPKMPPRPTQTRNKLAIEDVPPEQPPRRLPPPSAGKSILSMGFNNKPKPNEIPEPSPRPILDSNQPTRAPAVSVKELTAANFDHEIQGKFALIDFYAPYCKYCKELEPIYKELARKFSHATDQLVIAKVDVNDHKVFMSRYDIQGYPTLMFFDGTGDVPEKYPYSRELEQLIDFLEQKTGLKAEDPAPTLPVPNGVPPPINLATKPKPTGQNRAGQSTPIPTPTRQTPGCLLCRDFYGPDSVAAQYPRQNLPRTGDICGYLADVLCSPFPSPTDKARAIFTWLHHNVAYDTAMFFGGNLRHVEPEENISTGLAVCGGYAGVFEAIALKAGLEAVMVTGHGKGYGHTPLKPGDPVPPRKPDGHAWNAVRIDGGEWKLLDACWGAGNVHNQVYTKAFKPHEFTMSNEEIGLKHFPQNEKYFFRADGSIPTWEEYMIGPTQGEPLQTFSSNSDHGLAGTSFSPPTKHISVHSDEVIRFQFSKVCEHWDHEKNGKGKPYCMILKIWGVDGKKDDLVPFERNEMWWWVDVRARDLGAPGQTITCYAVTSINGNDNVRGLTKEEFLRKKGRCGMGFGGVSAWELV